MREGRFRRAYIGIAGGSRPLPPRIAREARARRRASRWSRSSRAARPREAGLRPEDLIVDIDGDPVEGVDDLQRLMAAS